MNSIILSEVHHLKLRYDMAGGLAPLIGLDGIFLGSDGKWWVNISHPQYSGRTYWETTVPLTVLLKENPGLQKRILATLDREKTSPEVLEKLEAFLTLDPKKLEIARRNDRGEFVLTGDITGSTISIIRSNGRLQDATVKSIGYSEKYGFGVDTEFMESEKLRSKFAPFNSILELPQNSNFRALLNDAVPDPDNDPQLLSKWEALSFD